MSSLSVVMPAYNEAPNLPSVIAAVPLSELAEAGWETEVVVVDNASTDGTGDVARSLGARVVSQPERGYGNAYHAGFAAARGDVIATGDADRTYPFDALPGLLKVLEALDVEFLTTDRLGPGNRDAMQSTHSMGNHALSLVSRMLFRNGLHDSQSGMWVFRRYVWQSLDVRSTGMAFSQEIKNAATVAGCRCLEVPIAYRVRGGEVKLHALHDGTANLCQLFVHRFRRRSMSAALPAGDPAQASEALTGRGTAAL
ncbi:glycosyltransferase family 2 protein [Streptomyces sp. P9(2023)]|uniref:glycosyltransferase family 2 protein n=1 Tax=Streptomyces sp. P9(2023) TaxID=3064394 RepID=UPI0028F40933|nr:glycosyltransferase family 2 protein [Streptomyces sp. P9(2023)]MDT9692809.1 glycosyltransferase family 2 protein [Streptomyces sp. P9(2023)]